MRRHGKFWLYIGSALLAAALVGSAWAQSKSAGQLKVAIFSVNSASPTIHGMIESASAAAKARGWTVETYDGNGDQVATNNQAKTFINRHFDALINSASDNNQMRAVIEQADHAHIPFVSTFSGLVPGITVDIGSNNTVDGAISASELVSHIDGHGHVVKMNWNVLPALQERDRGFHAVMAGFPKVKVTEVEVKVPGQVDDTYNRLTDLLASNKDIVAVWTGWDEIGVAAVRAIQKAHRDDIKVYSMDGNSAAYDLIREGTPMESTVAYDVAGMGIAAVQAVADAVDGKKFEARQIYKKPCLITHATVPPAGQLPDFKTCPLFSADLPK
jgi:ABC-type sugar transport system substrate-binding protein